MAMILIFIITYLLVGPALLASGNECRVRDKYSPELWNGDPLEILAFTSDQDGFTCMLNFQRLDNYLFYDQIVLSNTGNKVIRTDHGNIKYLDIHTNLNATGWNEFVFTIDDSSTFKVTVRDELVLNYTVAYPVKTITTYGSNISLCSNPTWAVGENEAIVIPLYTRPQDNVEAEDSNLNNSSIFFTLSSTASFNPLIKVDGIKRYLTMRNGEILLSQDHFQPLDLKKYILEVHTQKQKVNINYKLDNDSKKLMEFQIATVLSYIEISSQGMSFTVDLDLNSILFTSASIKSNTATTTTTIAPTSTIITIKTSLASVLTTNEGTSPGSVAGIIITIIVLLALVVVGIIYYKKRKIPCMKSLSLGFHEEPQQDGVSYKSSKSNIAISLEDKNIKSINERKPYDDGNYSSSNPELVKLIEHKEEIRLEEENHTDDGNCSKSANNLKTLSQNAKGARLQEENHTDDGNYSKSTNNLETLSENAEGARYQEVQQKNANNEKINTNNMEKSYKRTEDKSDDMDELELTPESQSDLKDTDAHDDSPENKEKESGALPPHGDQITIESSQRNNILTDHQPPKDKIPSLPRTDLLQRPLPHRDHPPHTGSSHVNPIITSQNSISHPVYPELSQEEIDRRVNFNTSVYNSAIDRANKFIALGEYANAREALNHAMILINQSKVANDSRCKTKIIILQKKYGEVKTKIDNIFNPNITQPPQFPTSNEHQNAGNSDQLLLFESPSAGGNLQFSPENSSGQQIALPTNDSKSAGVLNQFHQTDYQQHDLGSINRSSSKRSSKPHYLTTVMSFKDERNQFQAKPKENLEHQTLTDEDKNVQERKLLLMPTEFPATIQQAKK